MIRSGASAYHPELAVDDRRWYSRRCQSKGCCTSAPPHNRKNHTHISHRAGGGGQHGCWMWQGCCQRSSCLVRNVVTFILARMASRGAASREHSTRMCRIAALPGSGGSTGAITHLSSARRCFLVVSSWRRLSLVGGAIIKLGNFFFGLNDFFMHEWC
jgi:hypothetical protein